ncbi:MAG: hypothetical protein NZM04_05440 [Methylacidiphilales bacterium]|nr:hypothetical protein [Candidatus Methylacidiphilales bacterium]
MPKQTGWKSLTLFEDDIFHEYFKKSMESALIFLSNYIKIKIQGKVCIASNIEYDVNAKDVPFLKIISTEKCHARKLKEIKLYLPVFGKFGNICDKYHNKPYPYVYIGAVVPGYLYFKEPLLAELFYIPSLNLWRMKSHDERNYILKEKEVVDIFLKNRIELININKIDKRTELINNIISDDNIDVNDSVFYISPYSMLISLFIDEIENGGDTTLRKIRRKWDNIKSTLYHLYTRPFHLRSPLAFSTWTHLIFAHPHHLWMFESQKKDLSIFTCPYVRFTSGRNKNKNIGLILELHQKVKISGNGGLYLDNNEKGLGRIASTIPFLNLNDRRRMSIAIKNISQGLPMVNHEIPLVRSVSSSMSSYIPFGTNLLVAYLPYQGYTYEDGFVLYEEDARHKLKTLVDFISRSHYCPEKNNMPQYDKDGIIKKGYLIKPGDVLVSKTDTGHPLLWNENIYAYVKEVRKLKKVDMVDILTTAVHEIDVGDKLVNRYAHKGVVNKILPHSHMPKFPDSDVCPSILINPLSIFKRMNLGQIFETVSGWNAFHLGCYIDVSHNISSQDIVFSLKTLSCLSWLLLSYGALEQELSLYLRYGAWHALKKLSAPSEEDRRILTDVILKHIANISQEITSDELDKTTIYNCIRDVLISPGINIKKEFPLQALISFCKKIRDFYKTRSPWFRYSGSPESCTFHLNLPNGVYTEKPILVGYSYYIVLHHLACMKINVSFDEKNIFLSSILQPAGGKRIAGAQRIGEMEQWAFQQYPAHGHLRDLWQTRSDPHVFYRGRKISATLAMALEYLYACGFKITWVSDEASEVIYKREEDD